MHVSRWSSSAVAAIVFLAWLVPPLHAQAPAQAAKRRFPTAEEVSRQFLSLHPKPRDEANNKLICLPHLHHLRSGREREDRVSVLVVD